MSQDDRAPLFDMKALKKDGFKVGNLIAVDPKLYEKFMIHIERKVKHDKVMTNLVLLTGLSAYTSEPINLFLRGESSIGKTYNTAQVLKYFPKYDVWLLGGLSPTALVHDRSLLVDKNGDPILLSEKPGKATPETEKQAYYERMKNSYYLVDLQGKILVFLEAPNIETFNKLRPILSHDAKEISYKFTDKTGKGQLQTMNVVIQGWPATIFCSTSEKFIQDLATRSFTVTPNMTEEKYKEANVLTGSMVAYPWKFEEDWDFAHLQGYVASWKDMLAELECVIPYAEQFARFFPSRSARSMRDFKHLLGLIQGSALFHYAQRPLLIRKIKVQVDSKDPLAPEYREKEVVYVMATLDDFVFVLDLWKEIKETTETSAAGHIIKFYHEVVETLAKETLAKPADFTVGQLTEKYNKLFNDRKSSDSIRKWIDFLCEIGYVTKEPDPNDKRQNRIKIIEQNKNGNCTQLSETDFFGLDSFKAWLNEAKTISEENQVLLRENLVSKKEVSSEEIYSKYFLNKSDVSSDIVPSGSQASSSESGSKQNDSDKSVQFPNLSLDDLVSVSWSDGFFALHKCGVCGYERMTSWQAETTKGATIPICEECVKQFEERRKVA
jgi:hypothetical protein